ncbi:hypothetical protein CPHO_09695 [Corynebacterium phocae]|uniref:Uncharacterized protein n=1 Tax=Corynebacterium phocae TaxID=161895 RepID=A0A1L7D4X9_9CORY|nr:hypothetical protein [Corynebacterium phocae]APT93117.1 hypothetical protein CPHO_09695 [Corynebacterium phocae]KAA8722191.1 hypothetical protein F4V58_09170 [Corynebacterium phocae]
MTDKDIIAQLRAANPVPDPALDPQQQQRADEALRQILAQDNVVSIHRRRPWFGTGAVAAAAAALLVIGGLGVPGFNNHTPQATAAELLLAAGQASAQQDDFLTTGVSNQAYLKRIDKNDRTTQVTEYEAARGAEPTQVTAVEGPAFDIALPVTAAELASATSAEQLKELAGGTPQGLVELLLHPSLSSAQHAAVYNALSQMDVNLQEHGEVATFSAGELTFRVLTHTGQLLEAHNLVAPGVTTTVEATAILGCVATPNLEGPAEISLGCADNNYVLHDIEWSNWGADTATATAVATINDCDPFCAEGKFVDLPVTVTLGQREECGFNAKLYSKLEVEFPGSQPQRSADTFDIGCIR